MENLDGTQPPKEFGPQASLLKRWVLGGICIVLVLAFLWFVATQLGDGQGCEGCMSFRGGESDGPPIWMFALGTLLVVAVALAAPVLARLGMKSGAESDDT